MFCGLAQARGIRRVGSNAAAVAAALSSKRWAGLELTSENPTGLTGKDRLRIGFMGAGLGARLGEVKKDNHAGLWNLTGLKERV